MACSTCKSKNKSYSALSNLSQAQQPEQDCLFSFSFLTEKLQEELAKPEPNPTHTFYLRSALNFYSKNCSKFNSQLSLFLL